MLTSTENTPQGYVVSVYYDVTGNGNYHWEKLRNFGDRQGDVIEFRDYDLPALSDAQIRQLIRQFDINVKYKRLGKNRYGKER